MGEEVTETVDTTEGGITHEVKSGTSEMSREEFDAKMREVALGESDTLPDGTKLSEVHENIDRLEAEQDEARANLKYDVIEDFVKPPEATGNVTVGVSPVGAVTVHDVLTEGDQSPTLLEGDLPADIPHRQLLLENKVLLADIDGLTQESLVGMGGIGSTKAKDVIKYLKNRAQVAAG